MKARFLALVALVLGLASCQKDTEGFDVAVDGEVSTKVTVNLADDSGTRAGGSNLSGIENGALVGDNTIRYILQVFDETGGQSKDKMFVYTDEKTAAFDVRLVPGRTYNFVVWADIVRADHQDWHYNTTDLKNITLNSDWVAMDETRDAYTDVETIQNFNSTSSINLTLTRPFAKLRVVTTDMKELMANVQPSKVEVTYTTDYRNAFNALAGAVVENAYSTTPKTHAKTAIVEYTETSVNNKTLFTDYLFASDSDDVVSFIFRAYDTNDVLMRETNFNTDIPVKRNYLTTITGNVLTDGNEVNVEIDDNFGENNENQIVRNTISSAAEFFAAIENGGDYILISDLNLSSASTASKFAATRASGSKTINIDLNDLTINVDNQTGAPLVELEDGDVLIFSGEGEVTASTNSGKLVDGGTVVVTGAAEVDEKAADAKTGIDALAHICANGGEFTFTDNLESSETVYVKTANPIVINGANFALTSSANRAIRFDEKTAANANVTINDLNIVVTTERVGTNDVRGVSIDPNLSNVTLTLNNCSVDFTSTSANDWTYAVNVSGNGTGHKVTVNGGTYEGANVVNAHGAKNTIVVKNATLNSLYPNSDLYYGSCIWVLQKQESSVYAEGNIFNGDNAIAFNLGTGTTLEEKNNTDNTQCVAIKVGNSYFYNIADAIAAAEDGATVKVLHDHTCKVGATVAKGKTLTLDLNGKTITGTDSSTGSYALITNQGNLTVTGKGTMTLVATNNRAWNAYSSVISNTVGGKLVVENGTIEHLGGTDMAYGIDNITNGKGTYAETVINGGTIKSTYRAVRMFLNGIEAQNLLTVNGGTIEGANKSIWMQDPSKNANTGTLVVNEGATLNGDVYLFVTAGSTEWPVSVSIAASAVNGEVLTGNVPEGYAVENINGVWVVNEYTAVTSATELDELLKNGKAVVMSNDITASANETTANSGYGATGVKVENGAVLDGNDKTLTINDAWGTWDCVVAATNGTIKNLTVNGAMRGIFMPGANGDVVIDNVTFNNVIYTFNSDDGNKNYGVYISNSTLNGWTSFSNAHKEVVFTNCSFGKGSGYAFCRPYNACVFEDCEFSTDMEFDTTQQTNIVFKNCTYGGVKITAENAASLKTGDVTFFYNGVGSVRFE